MMIALAAIGIVASASAHHSTAMYDYTKSQMLTGTVREFQWTNPHMFIKTMVADAKGNEVEWNVECGTPNVNARHGWKKTDLKPGDRVTLEIHPARDGMTAGTLVTVKLQDGRTLYGPGGDIVAVPSRTDSAPATNPDSASSR